MEEARFFERHWSFQSGDADLFRRNIPANVIAMIPAETARSEPIIPIDLLKDGTLSVAVLESCAEETLDKAVFIANRPVHAYIVSKSAMAYALQRYFPARAS
jgi:hypothetical protein